jgi:hypothetical protein
MLPVSHLLTEEIPASAIRNAFKQAAVWGLGGAVAAKVGQEKKKSLTKEEKKARWKDLLTQTGIGAAAGAAGSLI